MKKFLLMFVIVFSAFLLISCQDQSTPTGENVGTFASYEELKEYLSNINLNNFFYYLEETPESAQDDSVAITGEKRDYSQTNNQVEGVEEADTILTDGYYLYILSGSKFFIINADTLETVYQYEEEDDYFSGLYLYEDSIVLVGSYYTYDELLNPEVDGEYQSYYYRYNHGAKVIVLDKTDMENIEVQRELKFDSSYITSSRMIDGYLYLIMNNYLYSYFYDEENIIPKYQDSLTSDDFELLDISDIYYIPSDGQSYSYLMLASFKVDVDEEVDLKAYLGSTYQIYMSENNLYTTVYKYSYDQETFVYDYETFILRFAIEDNKLVYKAMGKISGAPLNQFSMDEYDGKFRIAVTDYDYSGEAALITNTLFILDATSEDKMDEVSSLSGLGKPGERIYAVRFSEDRAYVVTFVNTDPLYTLDLSDQENPVIIGEYYEEGVSDYLHEITDNLMIGVGRNAETDGYGNTYFTGVKIALYDTSGDESVNLETSFVEGEYSYTSVIYNHKAFVYFTPEDSDFTYIAIPVSIYYQNYYRYSQKLFVFKVHHTGDLELVAELEHFNDENNYFDTIEKAVMIENYIYTLSFSQVQVFDMNNDFSFVDKNIFNEMFYYYDDYKEEPVTTTVE
jgi:uncharacterized secreted protein with C-terminal beta-propeller domain